MNTLKLALVASLFCLAAAAAPSDPTPLLTRKPVSELIAVVKSDAAQKDKADACRQLGVVGDKDAVAALVALLPDEKLNHVARYALEPIPDPAVDAAFREALGTLKGRPLVGVIASVGVRKDAQAVGRLAQLLQDTDSDVVQGSARSLGAIATPAAAEALRAMLGRTTGPNQAAVCEGLLRCAEALAARGDTKQALSLYSELMDAARPQHVRIAAVRGAIVARGKDAATAMRQSLGSQDYVLFAAAVRAAYEMPGPDITKALASELTARADDDHKIVLIQALARRFDARSLAALEAAAKEGTKPVRVAAVKAMGETSNAAAAPSLINLMVSGDAEISAVARETLSGLPGKAVDEDVLALLKRKEPAQQLAGIDLIGRRRMVSAVPQLLKAANGSEPQVRAAAVKQVGDLGTPKDAPAILSVLPKLSSAEELDAAEQALGGLCAKAQQPQACTDQLTTALNQAKAAQKGVLLRVLSSVGGPAALKAVRAAVDDSNPDVHGAALRALGAWKTADAGPELLALAREGKNTTDQTLALRGYLALAANSDVPADQRLQMCREAAGLAKSNEEKKLLLAALGGIDSPESVSLIVPFLADDAVKDEAAAAVATIAEKMLKGQKAAEAAPRLIPSLEKVAQASVNEELSKRAKALLQQAQKKAAKP